MESKTILLISFGLGGHTEYYSDGNSWLSGYDNPDSLDLTKPHKLESVYDGAVLVDKRSVLQVNPRLAIDSPMVKVSLPPNTIDSVDVRLTDLFRLGGSFKQLAAMALRDSNWSGLDHISIDLWVKMWRGHGAKIGTVKGTTLTWETEPEQLPLYE